MPARPGRQRGIALISVLLVFALVVVLLSGVASRDQLDIHKTGLHLRQLQASHYALGGEALARQLLYADWQADQEGEASDHARESWYGEALFEPDRGRMRVRIRDLESRFNLNNLVDASGQIDREQAALLQRLLQELQLPDDRTAALADWIDSDTTPLSSASEDSYFLSHEPAYRSADQPLADPSELRATGLFDEDQLARLLPLVTALPETTTINPNTASAAVLAVLHPSPFAQRVISARDSEPFTSLQAFLSSDATAGMNLGDVESHIDVRSRYFEVLIDARFDDLDVFLRSVLHRDPQSGTITTLWRSLLRPRHDDPEAPSAGPAANAAPQ